MILGLVGNEWEQHIVTEIDSALNKWLDSVPDHRMDPHFTQRHPTDHSIQFAGTLLAKTPCFSTRV